MSCAKFECLGALHRSTAITFSPCVVFFPQLSEPIRHPLLSASSKKNKPAMLVTLDGLFFFSSLSLAGVSCGLALETHPAEHPTKRRLWAAANILCHGICLVLAGQGNFAFRYFWACATVVISFHTFSLFLLGNHVLDTRGLSLRQRLPCFIREWLNPRRLPLSCSESGDAQPWRSRLRFAVVKSMRAFLFWGMGKLDQKLAVIIHQRFHTTLYDFAPDQHGFVPIFTARHLVLRNHECVSWIVQTVWSLTAAHDLFSIIFVSVLQW